MPLSERNKVLIFLAPLVLAFAILLLPNSRDETWWPTEVAESLDYPNDSFPDVIGIELGRRYSRAGIFRNNMFEIFANEAGCNRFPSYVAFPSEGLPEVGYAALNWIHHDPKNTIYDLRRLIGRNFSDPDLQEEIKDLPYEVVERDGKLSIRITSSTIIWGEDKYFTPEKLTSYILASLKEMAEAHLNRTVKFAVITVPSYFNDAQSQATRDAAELAGLIALRLVNEPTAASIAYRMDLTDGERSYIVFNLGEKESNIALLSIDVGIFEILATAIDGSLGEEFQNVDSQHFYATTELMDTEEGLEAWKDLGLEARVSEQVSSEDVTFSAQYKLNPFQITKESLGPSKQLVERASKIVEQLLEDAKMKEREVKGIILTSDMTNISGLQVPDLLEPYLNKESIISYDGVVPDQAIVYGAAMQGFALTDPGDTCGCYVDVSQLSLGIELKDGRFFKLIKRNTVIPTLKTYIFSTTRDDQKDILIRIFEGERALARENRLAGILELKGLSPKPKGVPQIEVSFELDANENLKAVLREIESGKEVEFIAEVDIYTQEEIEDILSKAETYQKQDELALKEDVFQVEDSIEIDDRGADTRRVVGVEKLGLYAALKGYIIG